MKDTYNTILVHSNLASVVLLPMMFYPFAVEDGVFGLHCPFSLKEIIIILTNT